MNTNYLQEQLLKDTEQRIKEIEQQIFYIQMVDHWEDSDYEMIKSLREELQELRNRL